MTTDQFVLPGDIPLSEYPRPEVFLSEGKRIVREARSRGIVLRVMGPLALHYYFPDEIALYTRLERLGERYFTDIDFACYGKHRKKLMDFFSQMGYECDSQTLMASGDARQIYFGGAVPMVDVFIETLNYCHEIRFTGRLEYDDYSVSLSDVLLQKLQIVEINDKDLKDVEFLLTVANLGDDDARKVNIAYISKRLADDWGFWYTATQLNLPKVTAHVDGVSAFSDRQRMHVKGQVARLLARVEAEPKTRRWEKRAKKGTRKQWYNSGFGEW